jgi:hypothetical protein
MQALKLSKKYPEFKQDEIFDLVNKFRYVRVPLSLGAFYLLSPSPLAFIHITLALQSRMVPSGLCFDCC